MAGVVIDRRCSQVLALLCARFASLPLSMHRHHGGSHRAVSKHTLLQTPFPPYPTSPRGAQGHHEAALAPCAVRIRVLLQLPLTLRCWIVNFFGTRSHTPPWSKKNKPPLDPRTRLPDPCTGSLDSPPPPFIGLLHRICTRSVDPTPPPDTGSFALDYQSACSRSPDLWIPALRVSCRS